MSFLASVLPILFPVTLVGGGMNKELWCLAAGQGQLTRGEEEVKKVRKKGSGPIYPSELCLFQYARNMLM